MSTTAAEVSQHSQAQHSSFGCGFVPLFQLTSAPAAGRWALRGTLRSPSCQVRGRAGSMAKEQPEKQLVLHISHCWAGGSSPHAPSHSFMLHRRADGCLQQWSASTAALPGLWSPVGCSTLELFSSFCFGFVFGFGLLVVCTFPRNLFWGFVCF